MKKQIFILLCFLTFYKLHSQEILWTRNLNDQNEKIIDFQSNETTPITLTNNSLSSNLMKTDSLFKVVNQKKYNRIYSDFVSFNSSIFTSFLDNDLSGIEKIDSNGNIIKSIVLGDINSSNPKIFNWIDNKILLVDNLLYSSSQTFPRVTVLDQNLVVDTSFFLPQNSGLYEYAAAVVSPQNDLFITGVKETNAGNLDQMIVRIDNTLHIESSRSFGDNNKNWLNLEHQSIINFPGGIIISGQSITDSDTNVTLSVVSKDDISFSHNLISSSEPIFSTQESLVYLENQSIFLLVNSNTSSYLLIFDLTGTFKKAFLFNDNKRVNKLILSNNLIYAIGPKTITCIEPYETNATGLCQMTESTIFNTTVITNDWQPKPYFLDAVGFTDPLQNIIASSVSNDSLSFEISCPTLFFSGSITGCKTDTLCVSVTGDQSYIWYENNNPEDVLSTKDEFCFTPRENITYTIRGELGSTISFSPVVDSSPSCIPDTIPIVYDYISPNGDNENDEFYIKNLQFVRPLSLQIINAQNQVLYENNDYDNKWSPIDLPDGTYFFIVESEKLKQQGNLIIRR